MITGFGKLKNRWLPAGSMSANVMILLFGTAISQLIPFLSAPALTRMYSPADFGLLALFLSISSVSVTLATGRYELAVMLPKQAKEASALVWVTLILAVGFCFLLMLVIWGGGGDVILAWIEQPDFKVWLYWVPPIVFLMATYQVMNFWLNRHQKYSEITLGEICLKGSSEGSRLLYGLSGVLQGGLILGGIIGQLIANLFLLFQVVKKTVFPKERPTLKELKQALMDYKRFPVFSMPYSLVATFSSEFMVFLLASMGHIQAAGFFGLTRRMVITPIGLLSSSLGRVFFKEATDHLGTPYLKELTEKIMRHLAWVFAPAFIWFAWWAPDIFSFVFGEEWREAGQYARVLAPVAFLRLFTSWLSSIYEITQKQNVPLFIQLVFDIIRVVVLIGMLKVGKSPYDCVVAYSALTGLFLLVYWVGLFRVAYFPVAVIGKVLLSSFFTAVPVIISVIAIEFFYPNLRDQLVLTGVGGTIYFALLFYLNTK